MPFPLENTSTCYTQWFKIPYSVQNKESIQYNCLKFIQISSQWNYSFNFLNLTFLNKEKNPISSRSLHFFLLCINIELIWPLLTALSDHRNLTTYDLIILLFTTTICLKQKHLFFIHYLFSISLLGISYPSRYSPYSASTILIMQALCPKTMNFWVASSCDWLWQNIHKEQIIKSMLCHSFGSLIIQ